MYFSKNFLKYALVTKCIQKMTTRCQTYRMRCGVAPSYLLTLADLIPSILKVNNQHKQ